MTKPRTKKEIMKKMMDMRVRQGKHRCLDNMLFFETVIEALRWALGESDEIKVRVVYD